MKYNRIPFVLSVLFIVSACSTDEVVSSSTAPSSSENPSVLESSVESSSEGSSSEGHSEESSSSEESSVVPHEHHWGEAVYTWNNDHSKVEAKRICLDDDTHVEVETVDTTNEVTTAAGCNHVGKRTYTSNSFSNVAFTIQTYIEDIPMIEHHYSNVPSSHDETKHYYTCDVCEHIKEENHDFDSIVYKTYATRVDSVTYPGLADVTCSKCGYTKEIQHYVFEFIIHG